MNSARASLSAAGVLCSTRARLARLLGAVALLAGCGGGDGDGGTPPAPAPAAAPCPVATQVAGFVTLVGAARYEHVPPRPDGIGLDYARSSLRPIRGATAELLDGAGSTLARCATDSTGTYVFSLPFAQVPANVQVRVRAEMRKTSAGGGQWDFSVRDNTRGDALYVLDSPLFAPALSDIPQERDLQAASGFSLGTGYRAARAAAPFSILDVAFEATQKVLSAAPDQAFPPLKLLWSPANVTVDGDLSRGEIGTSFARFSPDKGHELFLLGQEDVDTDEYDRHVIAHEWGHYFQNAFSRDDSLGGAHGPGDRLDLRLAFSEGWGNGWAGIALNSPVYADSQGGLQGGGFSFNVSQAPPAGDRGWYSEASVHFLMWSFSQQAGIGFGPMFNVMTGGLRTSDSFTGIHNFASLLKGVVPGSAATIDTLLQGQGIAGQDALGTGETNSGGVAQALPIYRPVNGPHCVTDLAGTPNKLGNTVFIRFNLSGTRRVTLTSVAGQTGSDPDFAITRSDGEQFVFQEAGRDSEVGTVTLPAGNHTLELIDFEMLRAEPTVTGVRCFNLTIQ